MLNLDLLLKNNELVLVGRAAARGGMQEAGLYLRDTRFLSHFEMRIQDQPLHLLGVREIDEQTVAITSSNPALTLADGRRLQSQSLFIEQRIELSTELLVTTSITNFDREPVSVAIAFEIGADFRDMFDVRGMTPKRRARPLDLVVARHSARLAALGSDDREIATNITVTPNPERIVAGGAANGDQRVRIRAQFDLPHDQPRSIDLFFRFEPAGERLHAIGVDDRSFAPRFTVTSNSSDLDAYVNRGDRDLALLQTSFPEGEVPAAGIPWFIAPFGRDSLIVALQTMHAYPDRIAATLRLLARLQGEKDDPFREEEPGKILHEMRYGDMARSGQAPHSPYYGSIDSTPLFVMAFAQHYLWHEDDALFDELLPNVRRAIAWMEERGDLDGDRLLEFGAKAKDDVHITQQGWKDSFDSLHFADGREVDGPIALVEVQGYLFAAYRWLSEALWRRNDFTWSDALAVKAEAIRAAVEERFWMEDAGYYAQALDGAKNQVDAISSNPGHLLFCGLPADDRAGRVAHRLVNSDLHCGWGVRTLAGSMATYNPISYHNGSIWPHDSSLAMAGLASYGYQAFARQLANGLVALSTFAPDRRLHELYCGFARESEDAGPVDYPVSCTPQAWAAASGHLAIRSLLDIRPDPIGKTIRAIETLPPGLASIAVRGIEAFGKTFNIVGDVNGVRVVETAGN